MEEAKYGMDLFACRTLEDARGPAKGAVEPTSIRQGNPLRKKIVTGLVAALLLLVGMLAVPATSSARVAIGVSVNFGPPVLPVYVQPPCPGPGYIWTPGYWAYTPDAGYYWVPGTWVPAPFVGALWTPGYWGFSAGLYLWHPGYWGTRVGFYGGINYGFGYTGFGYHGGYWDHDRFYYNRAYNRIEGRRFDHAYFRRENEHFRGGRVSFNGGRGGINARPTRGEIDAARYRRFGAVNQQMRQERFARGNPAQRRSFNHGRPGIAATPRAGEFRGGRGFDRGPSANGPRNSAPRGREQWRSFGSGNAGRPERANGFQRSQYQARSGGPRGGESRAPQERRGGSPQQARDNGGHDHGNGHGGGHGNEHGRGGRR
jgi:WXXGXW repeat (2 copies)